MRRHYHCCTPTEIHQTQRLANFCYTADLSRRRSKNNTNGVGLADSTACRRCRMHIGREGLWYAMQGRMWFTKVYWCCRFRLREKKKRPHNDDPQEECQRQW
jgi:hypothetical protein